ncbi:transposase, partial [uncultured Selenomonas sp.]|uniref:IS66 family transposase n=1 Tax=uncultured Selenomonas sp. TaxID=159275 RepID=UPI00344F68A9
VLAVPFYRQERAWARLGFPLSRTNMANWAIALSRSTRWMKSRGRRCCPMDHRLSSIRSRRTCWTISWRCTSRRKLFPSCPSPLSE